MIRENMSSRKIWQWPICENYVYTKYLEKADSQKLVLAKINPLQVLYGR